MASTGSARADWPRPCPRCPAPAWMVRTGLAARVERGDGSIPMDPVSIEASSDRIVAKHVARDEHVNCRGFLTAASRNCDEMCVSSRPGTPARSPRRCRARAAWSPAVILSTEQTACRAGARCGTPRAGCGGSAPRCNAGVEPTRLPFSPVDPRALAEVDVARELGART